MKKILETFISGKSDPKFSDLKPGDVFVCGNHTYMKILTIPTSISLGDRNQCNAIYLLDGDPAEFSPDDKVIPKPNATLILEGIQ